MRGKAQKHARDRTGRQGSPVKPWFRFYVEVLDDPKVQSLSPALCRYWINCLCLAGKNNGVLPTMPGIAFGLRISEAEALQVMSDLESVGLMDRSKDGSFSPHNWNMRQYVSDFSTERVRRFRNKAQESRAKSPTSPANDEERNVSETFHVTHQSRSDQTRADFAGRNKDGSRNDRSVIGAADELIEQFFARK